jgi:hypothetical protein
MKQQSWHPREREYNPFDEGMRNLMEWKSYIRISKYLGSDYVFEKGKAIGIVTRHDVIEKS